MTAPGLHGAPGLSGGGIGGDVLLTGTTGFVGMALLERWLERTDRDVIALVRASGPEAARARVDAAVEDLFGERAEELAPRIRAVAADMTAPGLGLDAYERDLIAERVTTIVHSAASVSFSLSLQESRAINLEGTRRMLELARAAQSRGGLTHYAQVSTAFVSGTYPGSFSESDHDVGQEFHNSYERSKYESESLVRSCEGLPFTILRPSIVVGDRQTGWTASFNVLYWPLRAVSRGLFTAIPAFPGAPVDAVSIDYVADGIYELVESAPGMGETYHLTAGPHCSSIAELARLSSSYFDVPEPRAVAPDEFARLPLPRAHREALAAGAEYFPYFCMEGAFDDRATRARLEPAGITTSPLPDYMDTLLDFATNSRWGKRPISRWETLAAGGALALRAAS
ncbi:MAG: SDR family oxidoreductase [Solirubrobacteraceae bacterium]